jgi:hypothetical protein
VSVSGKAKLLSLRGDQQSSEPTIGIDEVTRKELKLKTDQPVDFSIQKVWWWGQFRWAWSASNPAYRISARLALLSVILGALGLILGIVGIIISLCD